MTLLAQEITKDAGIVFQPVNQGVFGDESFVLAQPGLLLAWKNTSGAPITVTFDPVTDPVRSARAGALDPGTINIEVADGTTRVHSLPEAYWNKANTAQWSLSSGADTTELRVAAMVVRANGGDGTNELPI